MFIFTELFGPIHSPKKPLQEAARRAAAAPPHELEQLFGPLCPPGLLAQADDGPNSRQRVFSVRVTFWTFLWQMLNPASSCRSAVRKVMVRIPTLSDTCSNSCRTAIPICIGHRSGPVGQ